MRAVAMVGKIGQESGGLLRPEMGVRVPTPDDPETSKEFDAATHGHEVERLWDASCCLAIGHRAKRPRSNQGSSSPPACVPHS